MNKRKNKMNQADWFGIAKLCLCLQAAVAGGLFSVGCAGKQPLYLEAEAGTRAADAGEIPDAGEISDSDEIPDAGEGSDTQGDSAGGNAIGDDAGPDSDADKRGAETCFVYVCGAVKCPGVYEVSAGSRVYEVIEQAGGLTKDAAQTSINQAQPISDGQMIEVLTAQQQKEEQAQSEAQAAGLLDLNTATVAQLMTLSGIGEAKASAIVAYREQSGRFQTVEDIKKVKGIGEGLFAKIRDQITVSVE